MMVFVCCKQRITSMNTILHKLPLIHTSRLIFSKRNHDDVRVLTLQNTIVYVKCSEKSYLKCMERKLIKLKRIYESQQ